MGRDTFDGDGQKRRFSSELSCRVCWPSPFLSNGFLSRTVGFTATLIQISDRDFHEVSSYKNIGDEIEDE